MPHAQRDVIAGEFVLRRIEVNRNQISSFSGFRRRTRAARNFRRSLGVTSNFNSISLRIMVWIRFYVAALKPLPGKSVSRQAPAIMVSRLPGNVTRENSRTFEPTSQGMLLFAGQLFSTIVGVVRSPGR